MTATTNKEERAGISAQTSVGSVAATTGGRGVKSCIATDHTSDGTGAGPSSRSVTVKHALSRERAVVHADSDVDTATVEEERFLRTKLQVPIPLAGIGLAENEIWRGSMARRSTSPRSKSASVVMASTTWLRPNGWQEPGTWCRRVVNTSQQKNAVLRQIRSWRTGSRRTSRRKGNAPRKARVPQAQRGGPKS